MVINKHFHLNFYFLRFADLAINNFTRSCRLAFLALLVMGPLLDFARVDTFLGVIGAITLAVETPIDGFTANFSVERERNGFFT